MRRQLKPCRPSFSGPTARIAREKGPGYEATKQQAVEFPQVLTSLHNNTGSRGRRPDL